MTKEKKKKLTPEDATRKVFQLFCSGLTPDQIRERAKAETWGLTERALSGVIESATDRLIKTAEALNLDTEVGKALVRLESLYNDAVEAKERKTALAVQKEINSMLRLKDRARHHDRGGGAVPEQSATQKAGPQRIEFAA